MSSRQVTPFDSIESAQEFIEILHESIEEALAEVEKDKASVKGPKAERHLEALQLINFKLSKLSDNMAKSRRLLNDLRTLRRLVLAERSIEAAVGRPAVKPSAVKKEAAISA